MNTANGFIKYIKISSKEEHFSFTKVEIIDSLFFTHFIYFETLTNSLSRSSETAKM